MVLSSREAGVEPFMSVGGAGVACCSSLFAGGYCARMQRKPPRAPTAMAVLWEEQPSGERDRSPSVSAGWWLQFRQCFSDIPPASLVPADPLCRAGHPSASRRRCWLLTAPFSREMSSAIWSLLTQKVTLPLNDLLIHGHKSWLLLRVTLC